jgi:ABC-type amino acid transport system permease subunit
VPQLKGFNFAGGAKVIPEFAALTIALSTYTAAFIAEIVRAGIAVGAQGTDGGGRVAWAFAR